MINLADLLSEFWETSDDYAEERRTPIGMALRFLNWSIEEVGRRRPWTDSSSDVCTIPVVGGTRQYAYSPLIQTIEAVRLGVAPDAPALTKTTLERMENNPHCVPRWRGGGIYVWPDWRIQEGLPLLYLEDESPGYLTLVPIPVVPDTLNLVVTRRFDARVTLDDVYSDAFTIPEVPDTYRSALLYGMLYRALTRPDMDVFTPELAKYYEAKFMAEVGPPLDIQTLENRRFNANLSLSLIPETPWSNRI